MASDLGRVVGSRQDAVLETLFLLKLTRRKGRDQYAKNNSTAIRPFFEKEETLLQFPDLVMASNLGRVVGSRQDH